MLIKNTIDITDNGNDFDYTFTNVRNPDIVVNGIFIYSFLWENCIFDSGMLNAPCWVRAEAEHSGNPTVAFIPAVL